MPKRKRAALKPNAGRSVRRPDSTGESGVPAAMGLRLTPELLSLFQQDAEEDGLGTSGSSDDEQQGEQGKGRKKQSLAVSVSFNASGVPILEVNGKAYPLQVSSEVPSRVQVYEESPDGKSLQEVANVHRKLIVQQDLDEKKKKAMRTKTSEARAGRDAQTLRQVKDGGKSTRTSSSPRHALSLLAADRDGDRDGDGLPPPPPLGARKKALEANSAQGGSGGGGGGGGGGGSGKKRKLACGGVSGGAAGSAASVVSSPPCAVHFRTVRVTGFTVRTTYDSYHQDLLDFFRSLPIDKKVGIMVPFGVKDRREEAGVCVGPQRRGEFLVAFTTLEAAQLAVKRSKEGVLYTSKSGERSKRKNVTVRVASVFQAQDAVRFAPRLSPGQTLPQLAASITPHLPLGLLGHADVRACVSGWAALAKSIMLGQGPPAVYVKVLTASHGAGFKESDPRSVGSSSSSAGKSGQDKDEGAEGAERRGLEEHMRRLDSALLLLKVRQQAQQHQQEQQGHHKPASSSSSSRASSSRTSSAWRRAGAAKASGGDEPSEEEKAAERARAESKANIKALGFAIQLVDKARYVLANTVRCMRREEVVKEAAKRAATQAAKQAAPGT